ncbi:hypothetical protein PHBOTO_001419 [Pseudozyma hubeiensis]|nr:hypothetical protein PHBOTO_001419 [Pseudozyma hubeiensis]
MRGCETLAVSCTSTTMSIAICGSGHAASHLCSDLEILGSWLTTPSSHSLESSCYNCELHDSA